MQTIQKTNKLSLSHILISMSLPFFLLSTATVRSQLTIDLETVLALGGANNLTIKEFSQRQELAKAVQAANNEWWLPEIYAGIQTHQLGGAVMNGNGKFYLDVDRDNLWSGLGLHARWDFAEGITSAKAANLHVLASEYESLEQRNRSLLEIIETYYDLLAARIQNLYYQQLVNLADSLSEQIGLQVETGLRYQSEEMLARSNANHLKVQMLTSKSESDIQSAKLVGLLNLDPSVELVCADTVITPLDHPIELDLFPGDSIYNARPDFRTSNLILKSMELERKSKTFGLFIPELEINAFGSYFGDLDHSAVPVDRDLYPETKQLYGTRSINISLMWRIPLARLAYDGDLKQHNARMSIQRIRINQVKSKINEQVLASTRRLENASEQMEIASEGASLAYEALKQGLQRQSLGTVRPFELIQTQEIYLEMKLDYLQAVVAYNKAHFALEVAKGNNL